MIRANIGSECYILHLFECHGRLPVVLGLSTLEIIGEVDIMEKSFKREHWLSEFGYKNGSIPHLTPS